MYNNYRIAGLNVRMETFGRTLEQAEPYLCDSSAEPDILITSNPQALKASQPHLSLEDCEYLSTGGSFYRQLIRHDGILLHSSAVAIDGYAYVFSAPCGTGKSTHTTLWRKTFGDDRALIINDDKPALRREDGKWYAYGTPWSGKTAQNINSRVRLGGVCILARGEENKIEPYGGSKAVFSILEQTARPWNSSDRALILDLIGAILEDVPVWRMECTPTTDAAVMSHDAMSREAIARFTN